MENIQPVKRSKQLISLSREHHDALLFIWKIKEGLKNKTPQDVIVDYINWFWQNHLKDHFDDEERILLPHLPANDAPAQQMKDEHRSIRKLFDGNWNEPSITSLQTLLNDHIRFEERKLFPHIEQIVPPAQLDEIARQLNAHTSCSNEWSNEFWKKLK